jgi:chromate transport protein ChrA
VIGSSQAEPSVAAPPLRRFLLYFLKLGTTGFGGPIALTGYMQRDLVERRGWVSEQDYKEGLSLAQLAATGAIAGAVVVLGRRALVDGPTWAIALLTLVLLWRAQRIPQPALILGAGILGLLLPR